MIDLKKIPFEVEKFKELSAKSFDVHYNGHHATYVKNLNLMLRDVILEQENDLVKIMQESYSKFNEEQYRKIFYNSAQIWNHDFFWASLHHEKKDISVKMVALIEKSFGSVVNFEEEFYAQGVQMFGSGWVWLVYCQEQKELRIIQTQNAFNPIVLTSYIPVLVCDLWEHAYYIDFLNKRVDFLKIIIKKFNWEFANSQIDL